MIGFPMPTSQEEWDYISDKWCNYGNSDDEIDILDFSLLKVYSVY